MKNREIAVLFGRIADALDVKGEAAFKVLAYRKAARVLEDLTEDVADLARDGRLEEVPGIGSGTARKIEEYLATGRMKKYDEAVSGLPHGLLDLLAIQGLGPKTVNLVFSRLKVSNLEDLKRAIGDGRLAALPGMGDKKVENIRRGIETFEKVRERIPLGAAAAVADGVTAYLRTAPGIGRVDAAGSLRRMKETVGDIDILAEGRDGAALVRHFTRAPNVVRILAAGETKGSVIITSSAGERQADLRIVETACYGAALQYFTGSKDHNVKLRGLAKDRGLKISEYGVFKGEKRIAGRDEEAVYKAMGLPWIPPELREDRGEIERAAEGRLPDLVVVGDLRGDLHCHTQASDGHLTLEGLVEVGRSAGYAYIAVCDHSRSARYAGGLTPERLEEQIEAIDRINAGLKGFRLLKGTEVDILGDGTLDFPDALLRRLDFVVASVHSGFKKNVTERMLKALAHPLVDVIGHPSGRLLSGREGYEVDLDRVIEGARIHGKALELNSHVERLDLNDQHLRQAKEKGVPISIGTDSHDAEGPAMIRFGLGTARRGWLEKGDVLNALSVADLARWRGARKKAKR